MTPTDTLQANVAAVRAAIAAACTRAGRSPDEVTLVAVTKSVGIEVAELLPACGVADLAENRPQQLWQKAEALPRAIRWHLIGHLQRNKVERTLPQVHLTHAVDSLRLLEAIEAAGAKLQRRFPVLLEVNASREAAKQGFAPEELPTLVPTLAALKWADVRGLMGMAAYLPDAEQCRPTFQELRASRDQIAQALGRPLPELSMGMSHDFRVAVEEGATLVRIGTALFEGL